MDDIKRNSFLIAAGANIGIVLSLDKGTSWRSIGDNFKGKDIRQVIINRLKIYVAVFGEGIYKTDSSNIYND